MLQVFKSIPVVREILRADALPERARSYARDTLTLGWEERLKARGRRQSDGGRDFGTALPRGTMLHQGDCLVVDEARLVVVVVERAEPVFVIEPATAAEWALAAYAIGNSHQPLMVTATAIVCPDVSGMEQVLRYHAIAFRPSMAAFTPSSVGGGAYVPGHQHGPEGAR